jgi:hypothetical protein
MPILSLTRPNLNLVARAIRMMCFVCRTLVPALATSYSRASGPAIPEKGFRNVGNDRPSLIVRCPAQCTEVIALCVWYLDSTRQSSTRFGCCSVARVNQLHRVSSPSTCCSHSGNRILRAIFAPLARGVELQQQRRNHGDQLSAIMEIDRDVCCCGLLFADAIDSHRCETTKYDIPLFRM